MLSLDDAPCGRFPVLLLVVLLVLLLEQLPLSTSSKLGVALLASLYGAVGVIATVLPREESELAGGAVDVLAVAVPSKVGWRGDFCRKERMSARRGAGLATQSVATGGAGAASVSSNA